MADDTKQAKPPLNPPETLEQNQTEPQVPPRGPFPKYHKVVDSTYFRIALTGVLILLLFLTAFVIAVISELRRQKAEQFDQGVPPAEVIIPTPEPTTSQAPITDVSDWETYTIKAVELEFKLPPNLSGSGRLVERIKSETPFEGTTLCVSLDEFITSQTLCGFDYFGIIAISSDYDVGRGVGFGDFQGFLKKEGKYFGKVLEKEFEIPSEIVQENTNSNGVNMIKVIGRIDPEDGSDFPSPGEGWIGAIVNTPDETYPGLNVFMELRDRLTEETFDQILSTFQFLEE